MFHYEIDLTFLLYFNCQQAAIKQVEVYPDEHPQADHDDEPTEDISSDPQLGSGPLSMRFKLE